MNDFIYRYKYLNFDPHKSLKVITDSTTRFSMPTDFNDPFDCFPFIDPKQVTDEALKPLLKKLPISPADRLSQKKVLKRNLQRSIESGNYLGDFNSHIGVCCLSRSATEPLMWAHYADNHRGFVVEFKIPMLGTKDQVERSDYFLIPHEVDYSKHRPEITLLENDERQVELSLLTKSDHWDYEQEERVISYQRGPGVHNISPSLLCTVIAGMRMNPDHLHQLEQAIRNHNRTHYKNVRLYQAAPHDRKYKIEVADHPRLDSGANS